MRTTDPSTQSSRCRLLELGLAVSLLLPLLGAGACGSSSGDAFSEFEGTWRAESTSTSQLTCDTFAGTGVDASLPLWDRIVLARGTVSDLTETSGPADCQFAFDVKGKTASVPTTDPFTAMAAVCSVIVDSGNDSVGDLHDLILDVTPNPWDFNLVMPVKGQPPTAHLIGTSRGALTDVDVTANAIADMDTTCVYMVTLDLTKIAK